MEQDRAAFCCQRGNATPRGKFSAPMGTLLQWASQQNPTEVAVWSLLINGAVLGLALCLGAIVTGLLRRDAWAPQPTTRRELSLATLCLVCNSLVTLVGWRLFQAGILRVSADFGAWRTARDALVLFFVMDLAMFVTHRLAHAPLLYRHVHCVHHEHVQVKPLTLFVLHPLEVFGFGGLWLAVLYCGSFSLSGMLLYLTLNTSFGVVGHLGFEPLPKSWANSPIGRCIGTSSFHARHHQDPNSNFGFYTTLWDRWFGSSSSR